MIGAEQARACPTEPADGAPFGAGLTLSGFAVIALFSSGFTAWSMMVPIDGAVVAPGIVSVDSNVRTVQHLEGGIVDAVLVRDGDAVSAGEVLIRLRNTVPVSILNEVQAQYFEAHATEARLIAERDGRNGIAFPRELSEKVGDQAVREAIAGQQSIFASRRALLRERLTILERTKDGLESEIAGLEDQIRASERQRALIEDELATARMLFERKLTEKPRVLALERTQAELEGAIGQHRAAIGSARQRIEEAKLRMAELQASMAAEVVEQLRETRARAYELAQKLSTARDVMGRTEIRSPISGLVVGLAVHTVGGVIAAGQPLLGVVPVNDKLVIQATINPLDIDRVAIGLPATVWLSAANRRNQAAIEGRVQTVSADRLTDPNTGSAYYLARIELDSGSVERSAIPLQSGMGAEVMIRTGSRSTWDYISAPIARSLSRALREE